MINNLCAYLVISKWIISLMLNNRVIMFEDPSLLQVPILTCKCSV